MRAAATESVREGKRIIMRGGDKMVVIPHKNGSLTVEITITDPDDSVTHETLHVANRQSEFGTVVYRRRSNANETKRYPRDTKYPVGKPVRLVRHA